MISAAQLQRSLGSLTARRVRCLRVRPPYSTSTRILQQRPTMLRYALGRRLSTTHVSQTTTTAPRIISTPPLAVRTALVATTTAIGTPAFPVVGVVNFGLRYIVWDQETRLVVLGATTVIGGVVTLVNFAAFDLLPVVYSYASLFLPFAVVNGALAGTAFLALDVFYGTAAVAQLKWAGAAIGTFVGLVGPVSGLYDQAFQWFYELPDLDGWIKSGLGNRWMLPITVATGTMVGLAMHPLLYFPIVGIPGVHWAKFSAPVLAAATVLTGHLYSADYFNSGLFPPETYLTEEEKSHVMLVPRLHPKTLQVGDWGPRVGHQPSGTGSKAGAVLNKIETAKFGGRYTDKVFESKRKAWFHYVTKGMVGDNHAVGPERVPSKSEVSQKAQKYYVSDGTVAFIMARGEKPQQNDAMTMVREKVTNFALDLQATTRRKEQEAARTVGRVELASYGVAILMMLRKEGAGLTTAKETKWVERAIRKLVPGIILYETEEEEDTQGCSVEAQLDALGWKGIENEEMKRHTATIWKSGLERVRSAEHTQAKTRQMALAVTGLSIVLLFGLTGGRD